MEVREKEAEAGNPQGKGEKLCVKLPETEPEAFRMVLNYIYTDRIDPMEKGYNITY